MVPNTLTLTAGSPTATVTAYPRNRAGQVLSGVTVYFVSSDPSIATVDKNTGVVTRVASGTVTITGQLTDPAGNSAPAQPTISAGTPTSSGVTLTGSAFSDVGDTHAASQWQVTTSADVNYTTPVISTGDDAVNKTSYTATGLTASTAYIARVRYKDSAGNYSAWSASASFTTAAASVPLLVAHTFAGSTNGATSPAIDTTGATLLVVGVSYLQSAAAPTISDSKGNTWTALTQRVGGNVHNSRLYYCENPTVGTGHTFTMTGTGSKALFGVQAFSGTKNAAVFDAENGGTSGVALTSKATGSVTPAANNSVLVALLGLDLNIANVPAIDSGFTITDKQAPNAGSTGEIGFGMAYLIQGTAAAINPTWSWSANDYPTVHLAAFKAV